jgi:hypothetical protein
MAIPRLPEFVIIGAVKAATTWTARNLARNPRLFIPGPEPHYFSENYARGVDWYGDLFAAAPPGALIGEKSADYLAYEGAAARMAQVLPRGRLIAQLRNPIERAYSDYCMLFRRGTVTDAPEAYFSTESDVGRRFLEGGLYARHLSRFYDYFPRGQILVLSFEDIAADAAAVIERVSNFIGVTPHREDAALAGTENDRTTPLLPLPMRKALRPFKPAVKALRGKAWFKSVRGVFARPLRYPPLTAAAQARLADYYRKDIEGLSALVGCDYGRWLEASDQSGA